MKIQSVSYAAVSLLLVSSTLLAGCSSGTGATGDKSSGYPQKDVEYVVPFAPGGSSDLIARAVAKVSKKYLKVNTTVLNLPGGSTSIGLSKVINSAADGYTIGTFNNSGVQSPLTIDTPYVYYDVMTPIAQVAESPYVLVVKADAPWADLKAFAADIKARPNKLTTGAASAGGGTHFPLEALALGLGSDIRTVIFDGGSPAITALLGGNVDASVQAPADVKSLVEAGTLKAIATFGHKRMSDPVFADVPTAAEQGFEVYSMLWQGVAGPAKMDPAAVAVLDEYIKKATQDESVVKAVSGAGLGIAYLDSAQFGEKWASEAVYYKKLFASLGDRLKK